MEKDFLNARRRGCKGQEVLERRCRRVWPLNHQRRQGDGRIGERQSGSGGAVAVEGRECEEGVNAKRAPVLEEVNV